MEIYKHIGKKRNNLIIGFGLKDLIVVDAGDVILIMDKNKEQEIKHLLNDIVSERRYSDFM